MQIHSRGAVKQKTIEAAKGKWFGILRHFGVDELYLINRHGPCPLCEGKDRYRFDDKEGSGSYYCNCCGAGSGMDLLMKWKGWDFAEAAKNVDEIINNVEAKTFKQPGDPIVRLRKIQSELKPSSGINPVSLYLRSRNLPVNEQIQFHPGIKYYELGKYIDTFPAMVCKVFSFDGRPVTYHLTYLTNRGEKAPVSAVKKVLPPIMNISGSAIRLSVESEVMAVAEGVETALAVMRDYKIPCWSLINAGNLEKFEPPKITKRLIIFGDNDHSYTGQKSAYMLANRLAMKGFNIEVKIPDCVGADFADEARS